MKISTFCYTKKCIKSLKNGKNINRGEGLEQGGFTVKIDLGKCKLICEYVANANDMKFFIKEQIFKNNKGWLYVHYEGGERSCYGIKRGPMMYKAHQGISRISKEKYKLWRNLHTEFKDENGWFIDWEKEQKEDELWEDAEKQIKYFDKYILKSLKEEEIPF